MEEFLGMGERDLECKKESGIMGRRLGGVEAEGLGHWEVGM